VDRVRWGLPEPGQEVGGDGGYAPKSRPGESAGWSRRRLFNFEHIDGYSTLNFLIGGSEPRSRDFQVASRNDAGNCAQ
jgi:hypothetical protein